MGEKVGPGQQAREGEKRDVAGNHDHTNPETDKETRKRERENEQIIEGNIAPSFFNHNQYNQRNSAHRGRVRRMAANAFAIPVLPLPLAIASCCLRNGIPRIASARSCDSLSFNFWYSSRRGPVIV